MTNTQTTTETAYEMYAEQFGEKAAKRNAGRIAKIAELVGLYGAGNVSLREAHTSYWTEAAELRKSVAEAGGVILGSTNTSSNCTTFVVADIVDTTETVVENKQTVTQRPTEAMLHLINLEDGTVNVVDENGICVASATGESAEYLIESDEYARSHSFPAGGEDGLRWQTADEFASHLIKRDFLNWPAV